MNCLSLECLRGAPKREHYLQGFVCYYVYSCPDHLSPRHPLDRGHSGPQSQSGRWGVEKISCPYWESNTGHPGHSPSLYRLSHPVSCQSKQFINNIRDIPRCKSLPKHSLLCIFPLDFLRKSGECAQKPFSSSCFPTCVMPPPHQST